MPKVSIIVPVYNVEKYISKCVESIIYQSYKDFELIIVDDGSPDRSVEIVENYKDSRIKILRKENGGLSDARNYGLERSTGKYIIFVDSDDWIDSDFLSDSIGYMENNSEIDLIILGYIKDYEDKHEYIVKTDVIIPKRTSFLVKEQNLEIDSQIIDLMGYTVNKVYRRSLLQKGNYKFKKSITLVEDALFNFDVFKSINNILFINKAYYHYRIKPTKTLMTTFRSDPFKLTLKKTEALNILLKEWMFPESAINKALSICIVDGLIFSFNNIFVLKNELNLKQQKDYIIGLFNCEMVEKFVEYYPANTFQKKVLKQLIKQKKYYLIKYNFKLRKLIRGK